MLYGHFYACSHGDKDDSFRQNCDADLQVHSGLKNETSSANADNLGMIHSNKSIPVAARTQCVAIVEQNV